MIRKLTEMEVRVLAGARTGRLEFRIRDCAELLVEPDCDGERVEDVTAVVDQLAADGLLVFDVTDHQWTVTRAGDSLLRSSRAATPAARS